MHLFYIPQAIINNIDALISKFLWFGTRLECKIHLTRLNMISRPIQLGGWGIQDSKRFNIALLAFNLWRAFKERGIWHRIIFNKYLPYPELEEWVVAGAPINPYSSIILRSFKHVIPWFCSYLHWLVGNGQRIYIGMDAGRVFSIPIFSLSIVFTF